MFHAQSLVPSLVVINVDPFTNDAAAMLQRLEPMPVHALLFQCTHDPLDHPVLLVTVRRDKHLLDVITAYQRRVAVAGKDQTIIRP